MKPCRGSINFEFRFHHIGFAVHRMDNILITSKKFPMVELLSDIVFDPQQNVDLVLAKIGQLTIELVCGEKVSRFVSERNKLAFYHLCYEVKDFDSFIKEYSNIKGVILASHPQPAVLFDQRRFSFFMVKDFGLIEILEDNKK